MRQLAIGFFALLIGLPAVGRCQDTEFTCPYLVKRYVHAKKACPKANTCPKANNCCAKASGCKTADCACRTEAGTTCEGGCPTNETAFGRQAKVCHSKACQTGACQSPATACSSEASACQAKAVACNKTCQANAVACNKGCNKGSCAGCPSEEKIKHLQKAAHHLQAAGLKSEARHARATAQVLSRALLKQKIAQLEQLRSEIRQLKQDAVGPQQVVVRLQVAQVSLNRLPAECLERVGLEAVQTGCPHSPVTAKFTFHQLDRDRVDRLFDALSKQGAVSILAVPTVVTRDGQQISVAIAGTRTKRCSGQNPPCSCQTAPCGGNEVPCSAKNSACPCTDAPTKTRQLTARIDAVPTVLEDGRIRLELRPRYTELDPARGIELHGIHLPKLRVREVNTHCEVEPGKTVIIGGPVEQRMESRTECGKTLLVTHTVQTVFLVTPELVETAPPVDAPTAQAPTTTQQK